MFKDNRNWMIEDNNIYSMADSFKFTNLHIITEN